MWRAKPDRAGTKLALGLVAWEEISGASCMNSLFVIRITRFRDSDDTGRGPTKYFGRQKDHHRRKYYSCSKKASELVAQ